MKDIGIITLFYKNYNYGGMLQAFATPVVLKKLGYQAEVITYKQNYESLVKHKFYRLSNKEKISILKRKSLIKISGLFNKNINYGLKNRIKKFDNFMNEIPHSKIYEDKDFVDNLDNYKVLITGSDQVWNPISWNDIYFLDFGLKEQKRISYAASFGTSKLSEEDSSYLNEKLKKFDYISVREDSAANLVRNCIGYSPQVTLDPTLLLDDNDWKNYFPQLSKKDYNFKYALAYLVGSDKNQRVKIYEFCKNNNLILINIPHAQGHFKKFDEEYADIKAYETGPIEWMKLINNAEIVFTDSFHGLCFSLIFKIPFFVLNRTDTSGKVTSNNDRQYNLLNNVNLLDKKINNLNDFENINMESARNINWNFVESKLTDLRKTSVEFLDNSIRSCLNENNSK